MIVFDLQCPHGHVFEGWFASSDAYADQKARGLVQCPYCESVEIEKAVMAPRVGAKGNSGSPGRMKALLGEMARVQKTLIDRSDYVGERFADEARAIHLGEAEARSIWGIASRSQADSLAEEGIAVAPLPFPAVPPAQEN